MKIPKGEKLYFTSDHHFGIPNPTESSAREKTFLRWLEGIKADVFELFILGDLFDFWFEYKTVVPKGFVRVLGKLAEMADSGIRIHFFTGNHDLWMTDYLEREIGVTLYREVQSFQYGGKTFLIGHGDGLGPGDSGYKRMKKLFANPWAKRAFRWIHPDLGVRLGRYLSTQNKLISGDAGVGFSGEKNERLAQYAERKLQEKHYDYFIFGHRHLPLDMPIGARSRYVNLGDWITHFTYASFDGTQLLLEKYV
ncbi:MAG: UDP-2,3-diacylglucosamine diphosphatase [Flavobacteriales bacterium]